MLEELREPKTYFSILTAIAQGASKFNEISQNSYVEPNKLSKYLSVLSNLRLVKKKIPVTERKEFRRNAVYKISDNFFRFWFKFIHPHKSLIEKGDLEPVLSHIKNEFNKFVSYSFEDICEQALWELNKQNKLPFKFIKASSWWYKDKEIDIIALNESTKEILFAECKWQNKKMKLKDIKNLIEKSKFVKWNLNRLTATSTDESRKTAFGCQQIRSSFNSGCLSTRKEYFALFSKSGFTKKCLNYCKKNKVLCFDLKDLKKIFRKV